MAQLDYDCSIRQGFNFEKDSQVLVGHVVSMSIGGTALAADMTLTIPTDYSTASVVGVVSHISWVGGYADQVTIDFNVSTENQKTIAVMTHTNLSKTDVVFQFNIYCFDQVNKVYYLCFTSNSTDMNGLVNKRGGELELYISTEADGEVHSPLNYRFHIGIMPQESAQTLNVAFSNTDKIVKTWGVSVQGS